MKKILITTIIAAMITPCAFAQGGTNRTAKLSGMFQSYDDIKIIHNIENVADISWELSNTENGNYQAVENEKNETYIVDNKDAGKWIKAVITDLDGQKTETEPRQIMHNWTVKRGVDTIKDVVSDTGYDDVFTVDGMEFILLDTTEDEDSKFVVMAKNSIGKRRFTDEKNQYLTDLAGFLNNLDSVDFYFRGRKNTKDEGYANSGYLESKDFVMLPQSILNAVDKEHIWKTEPILRQTSDICYKAGIVIPSVTDLETYSEKIGWNSEECESFWLRSPNAFEGANVLYADTLDLENTGSVKTKNVSDPDAEFAIRPMFCLERNFFLNNKQDNAGKNILDAIFKTYTKDELLTIYTQEELSSLGYIDFEIKDVSLNTDKTQATVTVKSRQSEEKNIVVMVAVYDKMGMLSAVTMDTITCAQGDNLKDIPLYELTDENCSKVTAVVLESAQNPTPICNPFILKQ